MATKLQRIRSKLKKLYRANQERGGYRAVAAIVGCNVRYIHQVVKGGDLPTNPAARWALFDLLKEAKPMNVEEARLVHLLQTHHTGKDKAIVMNDRPGVPGLLREFYGSRLNAASPAAREKMDRELRAMIESINHDHDGLIGSSPYAGYWWLANENEGVEVVGAARKRAAAINDNAEHLLRNMQRIFGGQMELLK